MRSLACSLVENKGIKPEAICDAIAECAPCSEDENCKRAKQQVAAEAVSALTNTDRTLLIADGALNAFELVLRTVERVARFVPQARPASLVLRQINAELGTVRASIRAVRAANSESLRVIRLAA